MAPPGAGLGTIPPCLIPPCKPAWAYIPLLQRELEGAILFTILIAFALAVCFCLYVMHLCYCPWMIYAHYDEDVENQVDTPPLNTQNRRQVTKCRH